MSKPSATLTVPDVLERFQMYHREPGNSCWGSLHIVLDDGNLKDHHVKFA